MKKQIFAVLIIALFLSSSYALGQVNRSFKTGYRGSVELEGSAVKGKMSGGYEHPGDWFKLATIHGYRLGSGVFLGAGFGYAFWVSEDMEFGSLFVDAKYNFKDTTASPFVEGRMGYSFCTNSRYETGGLFVNGAAGVDFGRFSVRLGYEYLPLQQLDRSSGGLSRSYFSIDRVFLSLSFIF